MTQFIPKYAYVVSEVKLLKCVFDVRVGIR